MSVEDDAVVVESPATQAQDLALPQSLGSALDLWVELTGVEPADRGKGGRFTLGELSVQALHAEIAESLELDPTETTGRMLMSLIVQEYLQNTSFTADELLNRPEEALRYMDRARRVTGFLRGPEVAGRGDDFAGRMLQALERYGALNDEVRAIVEERGAHGDRGTLAVLRRDAMRTMSNLQVSQFLDGEPEASEVRPAYGRYLYRWANINSMLRAMVTAPSGVTVNMIESAGNPYGVHFVFAIRNGARLFVFTDKEQTPHPLAESMWRRPDKILAERANRNWFPYDIAGLKYTEDGKAYIETSKGRSLVEYQNSVHPVKALRDLSPPQVLWLVMMLDLIVERFWRQDYKSAELSYTGEMVRVSTPLLEAAQAAQLQVATSGSAVLEVKPIVMDDVVSGAVREEDVGILDGSDNRWLEDRYKHLVNKESLDVVRQANGRLLLSHEGTISTEDEVAGGLSHFARQKRLHSLVKIEALDPESFGTAAEIQRNRLFLARANYAAQIADHASKEFEEREEEVTTWVRQRMLSNLPNIEGLLGSQELWVATEWRDDRTWWDQCSNVRYTKEGWREFLRRREVLEVKEYLYQVAGGKGRVVAGRNPWRSGAPSCHYTGAQAAWVVSLVPETAEQLAWLCGVQKDGLPDVLQNWSQLKKHKGNHILNRVDPLAWKVKDPWSTELPLSLHVFISRRAMAGLEKKLQEEGSPKPPGYVERQVGKS